MTIVFKVSDNIKEKMINYYKDSFPSLTLVIKKHDLGSIKPSFFNFTTCVSIT